MPVKILVLRFYGIYINHYCSLETCEEEQKLKIELIENQRLTTIVLLEEEPV